MLPENRSFKIPEPWGWILNLVGIAWAILTTVLFVFPPEIPVTPTNMNYCIVAFGVILIISGGTWIFDGRKNYKGPVVGLQGMLHGAIDGLEGLDGAAHSDSVREDNLAEKR